MFFLGLLSYKMQMLQVIAGNFYKKYVKNSIITRCFKFNISSNALVSFISETERGMEHFNSAASSDEGLSVQTVYID